MAIFNSAINFQLKKGNCYFSSCKKEDKGQMGEKIMGSSTKTKERNPGLTGVVFSWSIDDVMNKDLYKNKVDQIQDTFSSVNYYLNSFVKPLIEETHADLRSNMTTLHSAPVRQIIRLVEGDDFEPPNKLFYEFKLEDFEEISEVYEPEVGDLIAITEVRPKCIDDLNGRKISYTVALVKGMSEEYPYWITVESSNLIFIEEAYEEFDGGEKGNLSHPLFAVYLTNLTTNQRVWKALHPQEGVNVDILNTVLRINPSVLEENCAFCSQKVESSDMSKSTDLIMSLGLDDSQKDAVLKSIALRECNHRNSVKLIWGPPGTGKTKTIASLLFSFFRMKCKALTCAPTNVAVLGVAKRLMSYLNGRTLEFDTYGLGDVLLSGNGKRMKITEHEDLYDVFLDYRVSALLYCFFPHSGWKGRVKEMIRLLIDPETQYLRYLEKLKDKDRESESEDGNVENGSLKEKGAKGLLRKLVIENKKKNTKEKVNSQGRGKSKRDADEGSKSKDVESESESEDDNVENGSLKERVKKKFLRKLVTENKKKNKKKNTKEKVKSQERGKSKCDGDGGSKNKDSEANNEEIVPWTFEEYFANNVFKIREQIALCTELLCTHMPTSCLPLHKLGKMIKAVDMLRTLENFLRGNKWSKESLIGRGSNLYEIRIKSLGMLNLISAIEVPDFYERPEVRNFCLIHACLIFCTVSSSSKFHTLAREPFELTIIDEAAQVKECESSIPLQLPGLRHAILVGDEKQLPAMVMSEICEKAGFGRSLFERLVILGHKKHLLNVQYRMHPSISLFPNKEFYGNQIRNGRNVTEEAHERHFLNEKIFGSYSFINITSGMEEFDNRHSRKNMVEVLVVAEIVSKLHKESMKSKEKVRVGCISPYKAQVFAIQESLGKSYSSDTKEKFSVNVRSVDGFQGGEEDIIIISTVRCNGNGCVGFLENLQRANVALTRARYCMWILGNSATLQNSATVWQRLIADAKNRSCFHNAYEDHNLSRAISNALIEIGQQRSLFTADSILFKAAKWKVCFSAEFHESLTRYRDSEIQREVASLLEKLSSGWRHQQHRDEADTPVEGTSSQLLEWDVVKGPLRLVWTIDILRENSTETQVINVLDILPKSEVAEVAKKLEVLVGDYTVNQLNRCRSKRNEGGLMLPMSWPVDRSNSRSNYSSNDLATQLAAISLRNAPRKRTGKQWRNKNRGRSEVQHFMWK